MGQPSKRFRYRAYILRLWQERPASPERPAAWRFSVEDTRNGQRRGFASLKELVMFLQTQVVAREKTGEQEDGE